MMESTAYNFDSYRDAELYLTEDTARADLRKAHFEEMDGFGTRPAEDYRFVFNVSDGNVADVVSDQYRLTQHREFFAPAIEAARNLFPNPRSIRVRDSRERVDVEVVSSNDVDAENLEKGDVVAYGVKFSNSFDRSIRETVSPYCRRLVCTNGMMLRQNVGQVRHYHRGDYEPEDIIKATSQLLEEQTTLVPRIIADAASRVIPDDRFVMDEDEDAVRSERAIADAAGFGSSYVEEIGTQFGAQIAGGDEPTDWTLYNAATNVIDHQHSEVREQRRERLHVQAESILSGDAHSRVLEEAVDTVPA